MSTERKTIDEITRTKSAIDGAERLPGRDSSGDFKTLISSIYTYFKNTIIDTDASFTANSDNVVASQKATKSYVDGIVSGTVIYSITANYIVLDNDGYDVILVDPSAGNIAITLPAASGNNNRILKINVTESGGLVSISGVDVDSVYLNGSGDFVEFGCDGTEWHIMKLVASYDSGWISRSDWTNVHSGSVELTYDNLGGAGFTVGEKITEATSGYTGIITADSGTVLKLKNVTGGFFTNDREITGETSGETADVNGDTKNQDSNLYHQLNNNVGDMDTKYIFSTDGTDGNSFISYGASDGGGNNGYNAYQVDTNSLKLQTGSGGPLYIDDSGVARAIDTEDWFYKIIVQRTI